MDDQTSLKIHLQHQSFCTDELEIQADMRRAQWHIQWNLNPAALVLPISSTAKHSSSNQPLRRPHDNPENARFQSVCNVVGICAAYPAADSV